MVGISLALIHALNWVMEVNFGLRRIDAVKANLKEAVT
jgi:hypothetical protein